MPVNLSAPDPADLHPVAGLRIGTATGGDGQVWTAVQ